MRTHALCGWQQLRVRKAAGAEVENEAEEEEGEQTVGEYADEG